MVSSFPGPNVAWASVDASSWVTSWHGSRLTGDPEGLADAGVDAVGVGVADGDVGADVAGAGGGSGIGVDDEIEAGAAGAVVGGAIAVADSFGSVVTLLLLDDLQELMSKAGVMTTRTSAARRCISGLSVNVVLRRRSTRLKRKSARRTSVRNYVGGCPGVCVVDPPSGVVNVDPPCPSFL